MSGKEKEGSRGRERERWRALPVTQNDIDALFAAVPAEGLSERVAARDNGKSGPRPETPLHR